MNLFYKKYKFSGFLLLINIFSAPFLFAGELEKESFLLDKKTIFAEAFNNTPTIENINSSFLSSKLTKNQYLENFQTNFEGDISYFKTQEDAFVDFIPIAPKERNFSIALKKDFISGIAFEASNNIRNTRYQNYGNDVENYISLDLTIDLYQDFFGRNSKARIAYLGYEEEIAKIKKEIDTEIFLNSLYRIYISLIFNEEQIRISNNILDIYIKQENDARRRYNNGITDLSEVKRRSSQVESKKVDILALKNSKENLILNLKELLPSLALKNIELASYNTNSLETYFINIINKIDSKKDTPMDYTSYDEMVRLIENSYKKQKKFTNNYSDIDLELYSNYKHIGQNNNDRDALNNLYLQSDHSYEVGLRLTAPIGKTKINSEKIQLSLQQSNFLAKKRKNLSKIHAYHSQSLKNLQLLRSAQQYQSKNSNDLKKILSLSDKKYKQARIPLRDLIEDQNLYLQSLLRELDIKLAIINQILDYMTVFTTTPFAFTENG